MTLALAIWGAVALRNPGLLHVPAFLYEDGPVFYVQAHESGWGALVAPYAGYHHLILRLIAAAGQAVPFHVAPLVFAWGSLLTTWAVAVWMLALRLPIALRAGMALSIAFIPTYPGQYNHLTNLPWILALLWPAWWMQDVPEGRLHRWMIWIVGSLLALTGPLGLLAFPLFVLRYRRTRHVFWRTCLLVWAVPLAVQLATLVTHPVVRGSFQEPGLADYALTFMRGWLNPLTGSAVLTLAAWLGATVVLWWRRERRDLWLLAVFALIALAAGYWRTRHDLASVSIYGSSTRYLILPSMMVVWTILAAGSLLGASRRPWITIAAFVVAGWICGLTTWRYPSNPTYVPSPPLETYTALHAAGEPVTVHLPFGWTMELKARGPEDSGR